MQLLQPLNTYLFRAQSRSGTSLEAGDAADNKTRQKYCTHRNYMLMKRM